MSNILNNTISLQEVLESLQNKAAGGADPILQDKTVTPTTSTQTVTADNGYDGLDTVTVNAMPTATQATPSISVSSSGLITASATQTAGYVTAGTKSATKQLTTQAAKTITPSTSSQTAVAKDRYTTGVVTVAAIPSNYEDVATETSAYTTKIASLETAIVALESALEGKAGSGSGGGSVETCTVALLSAGIYYYTDENMTLQSVEGATNITVVKNTMVGVESNFAQSGTTVELLVDGQCQTVFWTGSHGYVAVSGDGSLMLRVAGSGN